MDQTRGPLYSSLGLCTSCETACQCRNTCMSACYSVVLLHPATTWHYSMESGCCAFLCCLQEQRAQLWQKKSETGVHEMFSKCNFACLGFPALRTALCTLSYCYIAKVRKRDISARVRLYQLHHDVESSTTFPPLSLHYLSLSPLMPCVCIYNTSLLFFPPLTLHYLSLL